MTEREFMEADEAFDRAETLRWKREQENDQLEDNGDGLHNWGGSLRGF